MTPENPLEHALIAAATEPDARSTFYRLMLESPLFIVDDSEHAPATDGIRPLEGGEQLRIPTIEIDGVPHTPIFSSLPSLRAVIDSERKYIAMNGRQLLEIVQASPLILNPGSPCGKQFVPSETAAMLSGEIFRDYSTRTIEKATQILLGQPANYPGHLTEALAKRFRELSTVDAAYLAHCAFPDTTDPPHTIIGVDARGDWAPIVDATMRTIRQVARENEIVDVVRLDESEVSRYMRNETKPFYKRKKFGLF
jgi:hypothetical protein